MSQEEFEGRPAPRLDTPIAQPASTVVLSDEEVAFIEARRQAAQAPAHVAELGQVVSDVVHLPESPELEEVAPVVAVPESKPAIEVKPETPPVVAEPAAPVLPEVAPTSAAPAPQAPTAESDADYDAEQKKAPLYRAFLMRVDPDVPESKEFSALLRDNILLAMPGLASFRLPPGFMQEDFDKMMQGAQYDPLAQRWVYVDAEQERIAEQIGTASSCHAPSYFNGQAAQQRALARDGVTWDQRLRLSDGSLFSLVRSHGNQDTSPVGRLRKAKGGGVPVTLYLPKSGFAVTFRTPHEREFCDLDMALAAETASLGISSYGMLLSASSGIYMRHMITQVMQFVTATSLNAEGGDMSTVILANMNMLDAGLFILGPIIAKYPGGLPWELICPQASCGHSEQVSLNLSRCIRPGNGLFADEQLDYIVRTRGRMVTSAEVANYQSKAIIPESHTFTYTLADGTRLKIYWGHSTALEYFNHSNGWIETNNAITNAALMEHPTEALREQHLRITADQRRLLRNLHFVKSFDIIDEDGAVTAESKVEEIVRALEEMSEDREYIAAFESALANYIEDSRMFVIGYMADSCPACHANAGETGDGTYRGLVSLSSDRIFFTLSRVASGIQDQLAKVYADIG